MNWTAVSATQTGARHHRDERPNQDAHLTCVRNYGATVVVADGHGHRAHPRSGVGSALAARHLSELLDGALPGLTDVATAETSVRDQIGPALVAAWRSSVEAHAAAHPFSADAPRDAEETWLRYGTTLVAMAANADVVVVVQLGDGDAVVVSDSGEVLRPLPEDELLDGVRTTSLCQPDPLASLRVVALPAARMRLGYVCTDGFGKPQLDDSWWRQVGTELADRATEHGADWLAEKLPGWLTEPAEVGGDDTTMAVLLRA